MEAGALRYPSGKRELSSADLAACEALLGDGSRTFFTASRLLPRRARHGAIALYAMCRIADDAIDRSDHAGAALQALRMRLARIHAAKPDDHFVDRAFAWAVTEHAIPAALPEALLDGFAWDARGRRYRTLPELHAYAVRVAGSVGTMMALMMGARSREALSRACDLGVAMQLTNIARDVGEDARLGRLYLPEAWMRDAGLDPDRWLESPVFDNRLKQVLARLLADADAFYRRGAAGLGALPAACRPGIRLAGRLYAEIGREVERRGHDSVNGRAVVSRWRQVAVAVGALSLPLDRTALRDAPLPEASALIDAAAAVDAPRVEHRAWFGTARLIAILELFERLERRDRLAAASRRAGGRTWNPAG